MAVIELTEIAPITRTRRMHWAWFAVGAVIAGLAGGLIATVANSRSAASAPVVSHHVRLEITGAGRAYAAIGRTGQPVEALRVGEHQITGPAALLLVVNSNAAAGCRIVVDGAVVDEETADGGAAACVAHLQG